MAPGMLFGLAVIGAGIFALAISVPLARAAAKLRTWWSEVDIAFYTKRGTSQVRFIGIAWIVIGTGIVVYSALTGN